MTHDANRDYFCLNMSMGALDAALETCGISLQNVAKSFSLAYDDSRSSGIGLVLSLRRQEPETQPLQLHHHFAPVIPFPRGALILAALLLDPVDRRAVYLAGRDLRRPGRRRQTCSIIPPM